LYIIVLIQIYYKEKYMLFKKKDNIHTYEGDIIICLVEERPFSQIPDGRRMIADLTKITVSSNLSKISHTFSDETPVVYSENTPAVPVIITNRKADKGKKDNDWTYDVSPITELNYAPIQKWWPKCIFRGTVRLDGAPEEIILDYNGRCIIKLAVSYAYTGTEKAYFSDIHENTTVLEAKEDGEVDHVIGSNVHFAIDEDGIHMVESKQEEERTGTFSTRSQYAEESSEGDENTAPKPIDTTPSPQAAEDERQHRLALLYGVLGIVGGLSVIVFALLKRYRKK
jgi:hypothetical protein